MPSCQSFPSLNKWRRARTESCSAGAGWERCRGGASFLRAHPHARRTVWPLTKGTSRAIEEGEDSHHSAFALRLLRRARGTPIDTDLGGLAEPSRTRIKGTIFFRTQQQPDGAPYLIVIPNPPAPTRFGFARRPKRPPGSRRDWRAGRNGLWRAKLRIIASSRWFP